MKISLLIKSLIVDRRFGKGDARFNFVKEKEYENNEAWDFFYLNNIRRAYKVSGKRPKRSYFRYQDSLGVPEPPS